jgi:hypothetical protein
MARLIRKFRYGRISRGEMVILAFFCVQALDAAFTYWGVAIYGHSIEANPIIARMMHAMGEGPALASAKVAAAGFGIILHLTHVHRIVAALTLFYICAAIGPWMWVLSH